MDQTDDSSHGPWLADYDDHLQRVVGAAPATRQRYGTTVRRFLSSCFGTGAPNWAILSVETVVDFIRQEAATKTGHGRSAPAVAFSTLPGGAWRRAGRAGSGHPRHPALAARQPAAAALHRPGRSTGGRGWCWSDSSARPGHPAAAGTSRDARRRSGEA